MEAETHQATRLSIFYLLCVTAGVAVAIAFAQVIIQLRYPADVIYHQSRTLKLSAFDALVASLYGACATTFVFAWRSGKLWDSPGKILAFLLAIMCVLNLGLDLFAAGVMEYRMRIDSPLREQWGERPPMALGRIAGIWYRNFAPSVGYVVALPILVWVIFKTRSQRPYWLAVWIGFFIATFLIAGSIHFDFDRLLPSWAQSWYFDTSIGIPVVLIACALMTDLARRQRIDWWTSVTASLVIGVWIILIAQRFI